VATIGFAAIAAFILFDFPANTKKLTERERYIAINRLRSGNVNIRSDPNEVMSKRKSFAMAVKDWRTWPLIVGYMVIVGSSTLSYFYPTLVNGLGYKDRVTAQYMTVPIYAVAFVCTLATGWVSDRIVNLRGYVIAGWLTLSLVTSIVVCTVYGYTIRYAMLVLMAAGLWSANGLALSYASSTLGDLPAEARAVGLALINAMGNLASIYGSYLFPIEDGPKYLKGFGVISGLLGLGVCVYAVLNVVLKRKHS
jgi:predicted MFS family arabinose efflux permease